MVLQSASQLGHHNVIVQAQGDNICVRVGSPQLRLIPVSARVRENPRREIDILNPAFQSVPLVGRNEDMRFLDEWLAKDAKIAVTAIVGPGGSGKTRLALDFLQRLPPRWQGGFLMTTEAERFLDQENLSEWSWQAPTIVVVDYAASMTETLGRWLSELADHPAPENPLRILLLERHADYDSGWFHDLADRTWHGQAVRELFAPVEPRRVAPLIEAKHRREVLQTGLDAAASLGPSKMATSRLPAPGEDPWFDLKLSADQWADPLLLLMAATIAVSAGLTAAMSLSRSDLAKKLAARERDLVRKSVESPVAKDMLAHLFACVTLCGGLERDRAVEVAEGEFRAQHKQYPGGTGQAVNDLARFLGTKDMLPPLVPDLIGESLLPITFGRDGGTIAARLAHSATEGVVSTLTRSAQDFGPAGERWPVEWLELIVSKRDWKVLPKIEAALPNETVILKELAVDVTRLLVERLLERPGPASLIQKAQLGRFWARLAARQRLVGRLREALVSISEAVRIHRAVAEMDRENGLPILAETLNIQVMVQIAIGRNSEALASITETVAIRRELEKRASSIYRRGLAVSLNNLASCQVLIGQNTEALESFIEAVLIHREFACNNPSDISSHYLAGSLTSQCGAQINLGQKVEALASITEAISLRRILAETNPDAYRSYLAESLINQCKVQGESGLTREALATITESVNIYRSLAEENSDVFFLPELAISLNSLGHSQHDAGQHPQALASVSEAVQINRTLAEKFPDAFAAALAHSLHNQANAHNDLGQHPEAITSLLECIHLHRELAAANPSMYGLTLFKSLNFLGGRLATVEQFAEAREALAESLRVISPLFLQNPGAYDNDLEGTVVSYLAYSAQAGLQPDAQLINPFSQVFVRKALWLTSQLSPNKP